MGLVNLPEGSPDRQPQANFLPLPRPAQLIGFRRGEELTPFQIERQLTPPLLFPLRNLLAQTLCWIQPNRSSEIPRRVGHREKNSPWKKDIHPLTKGGSLVFALVGGGEHGPHWWEKEVAPKHCSRRLAGPLSEHWGLPPEKRRYPLSGDYSQKRPTPLRAKDSSGPKSFPLGCPQNHFHSRFLHSPLGWESLPSLLPHSRRFPGRQGKERGKECYYLQGDFL
jgi:hypothetical protein